MQRRRAKLLIAGAAVAMIALCARDRPWQTPARPVRLRRSPSVATRVMALSQPVPGPMPLTIRVTSAGVSSAQPGTASQAIDWRDGTTTVFPISTCTNAADQTIYYTPDQTTSHTYLLAPDPKYAYSRETVDGEAGWLFQPAADDCFSAGECQTVGHTNGFFFMPDSAYPQPGSGAPHP